MQPDPAPVNLSFARDFKNWSSRSQIFKTLGVRGISSVIFIISEAILHWSDQIHDYDSHIENIQSK